MKNYAHVTPTNVKSFNSKLKAMSEGKSFSFNKGKEGAVLAISGAASANSANRDKC